MKYGEHFYKNNVVQLWQRMHRAAEENEQFPAQSPTTLNFASSFQFPRVRLLLFIVLRAWWYTETMFLCHSLPMLMHSRFVLKTQIELILAFVHLQCDKDPRQSACIRTTRFCFKKILHQHFCHVEHPIVVDEHLVRPLS